MVLINKTIITKIIQFVLIIKCIFKVNAGVAIPDCPEKSHSGQSALQVNVGLIGADYSTCCLITAHFTSKPNNNRNCGGRSYLYCGKMVFSIDPRITC